MTALRAFSVAFLAWHGALLFPGLAEPLFVAAAAAGGLIGGRFARHWRALLAIPAGAAAFAVLHLLLVESPALLGGTTPSPFDMVPLWADRQLWFALPLFAVGWVQGWLFEPKNFAWERLFNAVLVVVLFWSQGPYHVTFYPHPLALALAVSLFLASELVVLSGRLPRSWPTLAALLVLAAGVGLLWGLLGRYQDQATAAGGGLMKPDLFQFDFAPLVRLEDEITLGDNLVLLYREEGPPRPRYLRRMVLSDYDASRGFSVEGKPPTVGRRAQTFEPGASEGRTLVEQEYYLVNLDPSSFLGLNAPVSLTPYAQWNRSSFVNAYHVTSLVAGDEFWRLNDESDGLTAPERALAVKGGDDEIRALALSITKGLTTNYEKASAIQLYLRDNYYYSLKPGAPGPRGALKHFLFEGRKGYCSYFAFSMTLLLRSLDVPARIAVGFATDPNEAVLGFTPVRAFQAHAWVEVPFGESGWIDFDPTSERTLPGEPVRFPPAPDSQALSKLISEILEAHPRPLTDLPPEAAPRASLWDQAWSWGAVAWPWLLLGAAVVVNEAWRHRWRWLRLWSDNAGRTRLWWREVRHIARKSGRGPQPGETPEAWADRTADSDAVLLASATSQARYAAAAPMVPSAAARRLRRRFRRARPAVHRAVGFVLPWWPR